MSHTLDCPSSLPTGAPWVQLPSCLTWIVSAASYLVPCFHSGLLQATLNTTARAVFLKRNSDHVTPLFKFTSSFPFPIWSGPYYLSDLAFYWLLLFTPLHQHWAHVFPLTNQAYQAQSYLRTSFSLCLGHSSPSVCMAHCLKSLLRSHPSAGSSWPLYKMYPYLAVPIWLMSDFLLFPHWNIIFMREVV